MVHLTVSFSGPELANALADADEELGYFLKQLTQRVKPSEISDMVLNAVDVSKAERIAQQLEAYAKALRESI